jgi:hypothetical protein
VISRTGGIQAQVQVLTYANVVMGLVGGGHLPGIPIDPCAGWRLALTCPIFDAKISSLLFYVADHFSSIFLTSQVCA